MFPIVISYFFILTSNSFFVGAEATENPKLPFVEFDFSTLPTEGNDYYTLKLKVFTFNKDSDYEQMAKQKRRFPPEALCSGLAENLRMSNFKAEVIDKTKLRVYGRMVNDKLIPATKGLVESPNLDKAELPKIKNPSKA